VKFANTNRKFTTLDWFFSVFNIATWRFEQYVHGIFTVLGKWPTWRTILFYVFVFIFNSLHVSSTSCSSSGETNCINTTSGSCHSVSVVVSCEVNFRPAHDTATNTVTDTRGCIDKICLS